MRVPAAIGIAAAVALAGAVVVVAATRDQADTDHASTSVPSTPAYRGLPGDDPERQDPCWSEAGFG